MVVVLFVTIFIGRMKILSHKVTDGNMLQLQW